MKRILTIILLASTVVGCSYLDQDPEQLNTLDKVFASRNDTRAWFSRIYSNDYFPQDLWGSAYYNHFMFGNDDANNALDWHIPHVLNGSVSPEQPVASTDIYYFERYYQAIRHCNIFLENVDKCAELGLVEANRMKAEARFMRAMYHFWMLREYGPIPIVDHSFETGFIGRSTYDACVDWIIGEIDAAMPDMYEDRSEDDYGYPTQGAALAMKSRILLYAASPLFNGNTMYANWRNPDGTQLINQTYEPEKWKEAADAAYAVIQLNKYSLLKVSTEEGEPTFDDYVDNFRSISTTWNNELIWAKPQATSWYFLQSIPAVFHGWNGRTTVSLNLANAFFMADGSEARPLEEWFADRQWSEEAGNGTQANTFWMFCDREPRFYATCHFPNQYISYASPNNPDVWQTVEFWYLGNSGVANSTGDHNTTGLSPRKHFPLDAYSDKAEGVANSNNIPFPMIRYAEILLNYCEAMNEYKGEASHAEILPYLNEIRSRAGITTEYSGSYTKEEMREMIRHERRVELAIEGHRYFDVRRWLIAHGDEGVFNTPVYCLNVGSGTHAKDPEFFTMVEGMPRIFRVEHYLAPIKAAEVALNTELVQAPFY